MFCHAKNLQNYKLKGLDGEIGKVKDFYFDDTHWAIRYLVAETGTWLYDKQVLISPYALKSITMDDKIIAVNLTKKQIEDSPSIDTDKPVSKQFELSYYGYYGWPVYWVGGYTWGLYPYISRNPKTVKNGDEHEKDWDPHLRSTHNVSGYGIHATDGEIGHIRDFIIDDDTWEIRYLIVDTQNWWPGKKVLISPQWIKQVGWNESTVFVNLSRDQIKMSPEYTDDTLPTRMYELGLHQHYNHPGYWDKGEPLRF